VTEEVDERVAPVVERSARRRVASDVAVDLLRPVADVRVHVDPERGVLEPLLRARLVGRDLGDALADPDDEHDPARRRPLSRRVVQPAEELTDVGAAVAVAAAHG
jgi:hypothetical protein